jgi:hypothetical protein
VTVERRLAISNRLAALAVVLAALASAVSVLTPSLYRDNAAMVAQARGTDLATLLFVVPVLAVALRRARSGSLRGQLVVLGMLGYLVYAYAIFCFQVVVNPATPFHLAVFGLSSWALILRLPVLATVAHEKVGEALPRRSTAVFFGLIVLAFGGLWLSEILGAISSRQLPASVSSLGVPTSAVYTLDLAFLLPAMVITIVLLRRRAEMAPPMAIALLTFTIALVASVLGLVVVEALSGMGVQLLLAFAFAVIGAAATGMVVVGLRPPAPPPPAGLYSARLAGYVRDWSSDSGS